MKSSRVVVLMVIALFLLIMFTYARFDHVQQRLTQQRIEELNGRLDTLIATIRNSDARFQSYTDSVRKLEDRVGLVESEKKDLWAKVDSMTKDIETMRTALVTAKMDTNKQMVELGAISVKKGSKEKK